MTPAEDSRFFQHQGVDPLDIVRAALKNLEAGTIKQGGSTITQQVTRSFLLTPERSYIRKIKEVILSYRIEKAFSKEEILFLYLNQIYLGHGAYGVQAAAENYFGKPVQELTWRSAQFWQGFLRRPPAIRPSTITSRRGQRQVYVLNRMAEDGYITRGQANEALAVKLDIKPRRNIYVEEVPFYTEHVRRYAGVQLPLSWPVLLPRRQRGRVLHLGLPCFEHGLSVFWPHPRYAIFVQFS